MSLNVTISRFTETYGTPEVTVLSPGRVNIIGEHIDYSGGDVLPFAIDKNMILVGKKSSNPTSKITSLDFNDTIEISPSLQSSTDHWSRYFISAINTLKNHGMILSNFHICFKSDIPIGAGVSSSSALTCGFLKLVDKLFNLNLSNTSLIKLASMAENNTGVLGGVMDQTAIIHGIQKKALLINCLTQEISYVSSEIPNHEWLLINSGVQHNLVSTDYNKRSVESNEALLLIQSQFPEIQTLRDIDKRHLDFLRLNNSTLAKRARHFFNELKRVSKMVRALQQEDPDKAGKLLYQSHDSLQHHYEVSCPEIDYLITLLKKIKAVKGARIMGGGFGGSVICLIQKNTQEKIIEQIYPLYLQRFNIELSSFIANASDGLKIVT